MKPIIFSTPMVQAILAGRKTMTRRVIKPQPCYIHLSGRWIWTIPKSKLRDGCCTEVCSASREWWNYLLPDQTPIQVGDVLWVRETWGSYAEDNPDSFNCDIFFRADYPDGARTYEWREPDEFGEKIICDLPKWHPSIYMPKEAARIFLRVTSVRAERVQDITVEDAIAEGIECDNDINNPDPKTHEGIKNWNLAYAQFLFRELWDHINKKRGFGWDLDPWVWVYKFEQISAQEANHE